MHITGNIIFNNTNKYISISRDGFYGMYWQESGKFAKI